MKYTLPFTAVDDLHQPYQGLSEDEKDKIKSILYIMDPFSVSVEAYHELSQTESSLPRTHVLENCAKALDGKWDVKRTPGQAPGAELPFKLLLEKEIREYVSTVISCRLHCIVSYFIDNQAHLKLMLFD